MGQLHVCLVIEILWLVGLSKQVCGVIKTSSESFGITKFILKKVN